MTASTGREPETHTADGRPVQTLDTLPRVGIRDLARDRGRFLRPGRPRSPLWALGDRFLIDLSLGPKVVVTSSPQDAKAVFSDRDRTLSFGEMLRRFPPHEPLFGSDAYIFLEGEAHLNEKRRIAPPLHGKVLKSYERAMADAVLRRLPDQDCRMLLLAVTSIVELTKRRCRKADAASGSRLGIRKCQL